MSDLSVIFIWAVIFFSCVITNIFLAVRAEKKREDILKKRLEEMGHPPHFVRRQPPALRRVLPKQNKKED